jgi:hypothetical protein
MNKLSFRPLLQLIKEIFSPSGSEIFLSVFMALLLYGGVFYKRLFSQLLNSEPQSERYFHESIDQFFGVVNRWPFMDNLTSGLLWALIGVTLYISVIILINVVISIRNSSVIMDQSKNVATEILSLSYEFRRSFWLVLSAVYIFGYLKYIQNLLLHFNSDLTDKNWLFIVLGIFVVSAANYFLYVLISLVRQNPPLLGVKENYNIRV